MYCLVSDERGFNQTHLHKRIIRGQLLLLLILKLGFEPQKKLGELDLKKTCVANFDQLLKLPDRALTFVSIVSSSSWLA